MSADALAVAKINVTRFGATPLTIKGPTGKAVEGQSVIGITRARARALGSNRVDRLIAPETR